MPRRPAPDGRPASRTFLNEEFREARKGGKLDLKSESGETAVTAAEFLKRMKDVQRAGTGKDRGYASKKLGERTMVRMGGLWVDSRFTAACKITKVKYGSEAYFKLFETHKKLRDVFKLGTRLLIVTAKGKAVLIDEKGDETLDEAALKALFVDAPPKKNEAK